jgi:hypothetical protein
MKTKKATQTVREALMNRLGLAMRQLEGAQKKNDFMREKSLLLSIKEIASHLIQLPSSTPQTASKIVAELANEITKQSAAPGSTGRVTRNDIDVLTKIERDGKMRVKIKGLGQDIEYEDKKGTHQDVDEVAKDFFDLVQKQRNSSFISRLDEAVKLQFGFVPGKF